MARIFRLARTATLLAALAISSVAWAGMALDRSIIHLNAGDPESVDVTVSNNGDEPLYVDTEIVEVFNAGTPGEDRVPLGMSLDVPMLVSPNKLVIPAGQRRLLRLVNMAGHAEKERVFRVTAKPVPPPAVAERSGIRVMVGYQMLVIVGPQTPKPDLQSRRESGKLVLENRGNVNFMLHSGLQCPAGVDPKQAGAACGSFKGTRLYPGNSMTIELAHETPVLFTVTDGEKNFRRSF
jgi:Mat/Ecp fimbriae periplasmic chaperone